MKNTCCCSSDSGQEEFFMTNRVRRIITVFLIAVTLFTAVPLTVSAAEKLEAPTNFRWEGLTLR